MAGKKILSRIVPALCAGARRQPAAGNLPLVLIAAAALALGAFVYVLDRPAGSASLLPSIFSLAGTLPRAFGEAGGHLPEFVHVYALILLTAAVSPWPRSLPLACAGWFAIDSLFELGQHPSLAPRIASSLPDWFRHAPVLDHAAGYFLRGTFDPWDLASIALGAAGACLTVAWVRRSGATVQALKPRSRLLRSLGVAGVATAGLVGILGSGGGGGGGGGTSPGFGNTLPSFSGPGDVENFFPDAPGTSWNYFVAASNPAPGVPSSYMDSITVTGTKPITGQTASVFLESNPSGSGMPLENYFLRNAGGVAFMGTNDATDTVTAGLVPQIVALFPLSPGVVAQFDKAGLDFGADLDGDGIDETVNVGVTNTVVDFEPLSLGIGSFARTLKATQALNGSVILSSTKMSIPFSSTQTTWSAPGIGIIRSDVSATAQSITTGQTMEARGYTSNGVAHGFGLPFTVEGSLPLNLLPVTDSPALATNGQNFLAATEDANGLTATLFDAQGSTINTLSLTTAPGSSFPVAGFDGTNYWVVYCPYDSVTSGSVTACFAKRISPSGTLIDATAINLVTVGGNFASIGFAGLAFGATNGLLAFTEFNNVTSQHELHGVLLKPDGTVAGTGEFPIATDNSTHQYPAVAFDGTNFLVVWQQLSTSGATVGSIYGVRVDPSGSVLDASPIAIATAPSGDISPGVAFDGTNYLVVWARNQASGTDIYGARVSTTGALLDGPPASGGFAINAGGSLGRFSPKVAFSGAEYVVTWIASNLAAFSPLGVQAARLSTAGMLPSGTNMVITVSGPSNAAAYPVVASGGQRAAVVWLDAQNGMNMLAGSALFPF